MSMEKINDDLYAKSKFVIATEAEWVCLEPLRKMWKVPFTLLTNHSIYTVLIRYYFLLIHIPSSRQKRYHVYDTDKNLMRTLQF